MLHFKVSYRNQHFEHKCNLIYSLVYTKAFVFLSFLFWCLSVSLAMEIVSPNRFCRYAHMVHIDLQTSPMSHIYITPNTLWPSLLALYPGCNNHVFPLGQECQIFQLDTLTLNPGLRTMRLSVTSVKSVIDLYCLVWRSQRHMEGRSCSLAASSGERFHSCFRFLFSSTSCVVSWSRGPDGHRGESQALDFRTKYGGKNLI